MTLEWAKSGMVGPVCVSLWSYITDLFKLSLYNYIKVLSSQPLIIKSFEFLPMVDTFPGFEWKSFEKRQVAACCFS